MYYTWVEAVDHGELAGVCMMDMSAAFDVVDPELLLQKLQLYGFDDGAVEWMKNYLTNRSQSVYIDGSLSSPLDLEVGVPQGSILGPLCYIIFTNDLPESIHEDTVHDEHTASPNTHCSVCGGLCCFADDSTYSVGESDQDILSGNSLKKYKVIANYMTNKRLKLNDDKTHLQVMSTQQKRARGDIHVSISTPTETIQPIKSEKLLGIYIHENMKWSEYVQDNDQSLIKQLTSRLSALKLISRLASFKVRLMVANGIFCSKLIYGIALWGGCELGLLGSLQIIQNKAARFVTRRYRDEDEHFIATSIILKQCGWLSMKQLVFYHSVVLVYKTLKFQQPQYLFEKLSSVFPYDTRLANSNAIRTADQFQPSLELTKKSFVHRATKSFNLVPGSLRQTQNVNTFQKKLKQWVIENVEIL